MTLLRIEGLTIEGKSPTGEWAPTVSDFALTLGRGEVLALIGESGAGKSTVALAAMGYTRPGTRVAAGRVLLDGTDLIAASTRSRRAMRGLKMAYVAQSAQSAFNPALTVGDQIGEPLVIHRLKRRGAARELAVSLMSRLDLPSPSLLASRYPHQISGGQQQRAMLAMALACSPGLLILDEPTTALDATTQIEVLVALKEALRANDSGALYVSHDLAVVSQIADRIAVMRGGRLVEEGPTAEMIGAPKAFYTRQLVDAFTPQKEQGRRPTEGRAARKPLLQMGGISSGYGTRRLFRRRATEQRVLQDVTFDLLPGEVVAVVGESGSGKSTLARVIAGLQPIMDGKVDFKGDRLPADVRRRDRDTLRRIQIVPQSPDLSLNPAQTVGEAIGRPIEFFFGATGASRSERVSELLRLVGLPAEFAERYPSELSGGQRQRVSIARAFAAKPEIIICDEILSSLDALVAVQILDLMRSLRSKQSVAYIFISHDMKTVLDFADRVVVLYAGRVCEIGPVADVFRPPYHPYTRLLISSVPMLRRGWLESIIGARSSAQARAGGPVAADKGCPFQARCPVSISGVCDREAPPAQRTPSGKVLYCHHSIMELGSRQAHVGSDLDSNAY
jgi:peptide/nickel transport system ATP-binding protein